jgi:hypothetical protein
VTVTVKLTDSLEPTEYMRAMRSGAAGHKARGASQPRRVQPTAANTSSTEDLVEGTANPLVTATLADAAQAG